MCIFVMSYTSNWIPRLENAFLWTTLLMSKNGTSAKETVDASSLNQESNTLRRLGESSSSVSIDRPWSGRLHT